MKRLLIIPLLFLSVVLFGQFDETYADSAYTTKGIGLFVLCCALIMNAPGHGLGAM